MENKKRAYVNTGSTPNNESQVNETVLNHVHQHNTAPQHLRLLQYGLKIPNHQHAQLNQASSHQHQLTNLIPQHQHSLQSPYQHHPNSPNVYQNQLILHQQYPHQHQQKYQNHHEPLTNHNHYHYQTSPQLPNVHTHNLNQQNAHIWIPHRPPEHYHPQLQQSQKLDQPTKPSHVPKSKEVDRKKNVANQQLRSPPAKRPLEAPVKLQGWLHKQGSDGLMLWKRRWFVLSEYCLFYYKGSEEEKVLGSILLPSYKVSVCEPNDKINRKFAFKCEHANMRTYILAADSHELMMQWVNLLSMACLLQNTNKNEHVGQQLSSAPKVETPVIELRQQNPPQIVRSTPIHTHTSSNTTDLSNPSQQELSQYLQPLYANAPPKPRRLADGYPSPSSDVMDRISSEPKLIAMQQPYQYNIKPVYFPRDTVKSPINIYGNSQGHAQYDQQPFQQICNKHLHIPEYNIMRDKQTLERRTPDTYGRSKLNPHKGNCFSDYEDVYTEQYMYKRPLSPLSYSSNKLNPALSVPVVRPYTPLTMQGPKDNGLSLPEQQVKKFSSTVQRPHSADFLDYEVKHQNSRSIAKQPRPKSSLDINRNLSNDHYFYSEEHYAEKMRKSAQYLPNMTKYSNSQSEYASPSSQKWPIAYNKSDGENTFPLMRSNTQPINILSRNLQEFIHADPQPTRSRSVLSNGSLAKELDMDMQNKTHEHFSKECQSPTFQNKQDSYGYEEDLRRSSRDYDQFARSASARLPQSSSHLDGRPSSRDGGERKREESMKRLLEWKQRMLQSPLNRKLNPGINKAFYNKCNPYYGTMENGYSTMPNLEAYHDSPKFKTSAVQYNSYSSDDEASGSISIATRDTIPRSAPTKKLWTPASKPIQSKSSTSIAKGYENMISHMPQQGYMSHGPSQQDLSSDTSQSSNSYRATWQLGDRMNVSAGELLGRTHEELILLLIQLRRQSANSCNAIEACYNEIESIQSRLPKMDASKRLENLQKLEEIKQHLLELEKQYEKGKPLVNLVDNMVKLGSLYRFPKGQNSSLFVKDRLEFNQQMQERRLLAEERRDWSRMAPNHVLLQSKVQQLYQLDRLIQEESQTLHGLQQDKEEIERALGGLRQRLIKGFKDPAEIEQARKQQIILENELSRVHSMLAQNSRKLEETVAGNARLEQELMVLKQKLQITKQQRSSPQISNAGDSLPCVIGTSAMLESDLHRVQQKVGNLQRQRQELSMQVRQLTDRSNNLQQLRSSSTNSLYALQSNKRKTSTLWRETDLDTMNSVEHGGSLDNLASSPIPLSPLYINTNIKTQDSDIYGQSFKSSDSASDDTLYNQIALPQEKQEIKTVRIVKRESERRQRDREKTTSGKWDSVIEEEDASHHSNILYHSQSDPNDVSPNVSKLDSVILNRQGPVLNPSLQQTYVLKAPLNGATSELSPIFKSEAAKQIIHEMSAKDAPKQINRRAVPKEKRRHYTAPHNNLIMKSLSQLPIDDKDFDRLDVNIGRARDDLDMERALRQQIDAPDVVRSTLSNKELKYNESTIDNILGTPNKIFIPERYVPEQLPQLTAEEQQHRLRKVESIKKMLSDTIISGSTVNLASEETDSETPSNSLVNKNTSKMMEEKKQREHLLQLNQILAKQVMEMSKIVAGSNNAEE